MAYCRLAFPVPAKVSRVFIYKAFVRSPESLGLPATSKIRLSILQARCQALLVSYTGMQVFNP